MTPRGEYDRAAAAARRHERQQIANELGKQLPEPSEFVQQEAMARVQLGTPSPLQPQSPPPPPPVTSPAEPKRRSVFDMEKEENPYRHNAAPWYQWLCLDADGIETGHEYELVIPIGAHPKCPTCGSRVALPRQAHELNRAQKERDAKSVDW